MSTHHAQAVELAMIADPTATVPEIRSLTYDIALTQQGQIGIMGSWLREWNLSPTSSQAPMAWMSQPVRHAPPRGPRWTSCCAS
jgi:uncharacterized protein (DUF305 family)